jgi:hypothetical protein
MPLYDVIDTYLECEYNDFLMNILKLVNGKLNVHIVSRNDNNNIYIIKKIINKIWGCDISGFNNITIDDECNKYYKDTMNYSNKKQNDSIYMYENNVRVNTINIKLLFTDFKKFKFTEQKYYIQYLEYIINLNTINKIHYIVIINNFDYVLNEYYKSIVYMIEKNNLQFIIFTSNSNIKYTFKSFFVTLPFVFLRSNKLYITAYNNFKHNNAPSSLITDYMTSIKLNYNTLCNIVNYDIYKIVIMCKLYVYYLINDKGVHYATDNFIKESITTANIDNNIKHLEVEINNKLDSEYKFMYFINNYVNKYFIINKYLMFLAEHIILYHMTRHYIEQSSVSKKTLQTLYTKYKVINANIRYLTYILSSNIDTIEYLLIKLQSIMNYKYSIITTICEYLMLLQTNNITSINNYKVTINTLILSCIYNEPVLCNVHNIVYTLLNNNVNQLLDRLLYLKEMIKHITLCTNIETKNKHINNKFNKMLFILNNNNVI